tara:strand:+ start:4623 stop:5363 length:741 start_codon:yes stop_codon:yes gene_type:complete
MAEPTKEELELMMRMILGDKYDPDYMSKGKRSDQWSPVDRVEAGLDPRFEVEKAFPRQDSQSSKSGDYVWKDQQQKKQKEAGPALEGSYPFLSMVGGAKGVKGAKSLITSLYESAGKEAEPPPTVIDAKKSIPTKFRNPPEEAHIPSNPVTFEKVMRHSADGMEGMLYDYGKGPQPQVRAKIYQSAIESNAADLDMAQTIERMHKQDMITGSQTTFWELKPGDYGYKHALEKGFIGSDGKVWYTEF